jgi:hypothetical protein
LFAFGVPFGHILNFEFKKGQKALISGFLAVWDVMLIYVPAAPLCAIAILI